VIHRATAEFWKSYYALPVFIQQQADKNFALLQANPFHPSLHFKKIQNREGLWSARAGLHYRALAIEEGEELFWFWIGHHSEYDRIIKT
jgi:hypothetical protein